MYLFFNLLVKGEVLNNKNGLKQVLFSIYTKISPKKLPNIDIIKLAHLLLDDWIFSLLSFSTTVPKSKKYCLEQIPKIVISSNSK